MRWFVIMTIAVLLAVAAPIAGPAHAGKQDLQLKVTEAARMLGQHPRYRGMSQAQRERLVEFVTGNLLFVLGHEAGHAAISEMGIPVVAREEDAADVFATLMALMCGDAFADKVLENAALGWFYSDRRDRRQRVGMVYYDAHGIDLQRAYNIVCLMVGSNGSKFGYVADAAKLPAERQQTCVDDYLNATWSWQRVLEPHLRKPEQPQQTINISYGPGNGQHDAHATIAAHMKLLEVVAETLADRYVWRAPITLEMRTCGESYAGWHRGNKIVTVCYEMAEEFAELYRKFGRSMVFPSTGRISGTPERADSRKAFRPARP